MTTVLAEASYYTNTPEQISQEDGVIRATKTGISFDADGMDSGSQIYLLVKAENRLYLNTVGIYVFRLIGSINAVSVIGGRATGDNAKHSKQ